MGYDLKPYYKMEEQLAELSSKKRQYEDKLAKLRTIANRIPYFEKLLNETEELANIKKAVYRARTEPAITKNDLLSQLWSHITPLQQTKISIKAYVGEYHVHQERVIPGKDHDQAINPKAVRVGPVV